MSGKRISVVVGALGILGILGATNLTGPARSGVSRVRDGRKTIARPVRSLADDPLAKRACMLLARADTVPRTRIRQFAFLEPEYTITGWGLTVASIDPRPDGAVVRVLAAPLLRKPDAGVVGVMSSYGETYRIVDGELRLLECDPIREDPITMMGEM